MPQPTHSTPNLPLDLGNGLILRRASPADCDPLAEFNSRIHGEKEPDLTIGAWTRDLFKGNHPTYRLEDFLIVENSANGAIVSSSNLISQIWAYGGIPFNVGRPELIGTDPAYRRRGLVRAQMDVLHEWSLQRGELVQVITGIPNYYRQFGYEMTAAQDTGRYVHAMQTSMPVPANIDAYSLRPAAIRDIPLIMACYDLVEKRAALTCLRSAADWEYELTGKDPNNVDRVEVFIVENEQGQAIGALGINTVTWGSGLPIAFYGLLPNHSYLMVTPSVLRFLWQTGQTRMKPDQTLNRLVLLFGEQHPVYDVIDSRLMSNVNPYAFYMRVPDLPGFLHLITPVLEQRLASSACSGHTGLLRISFYQNGITLKLEAGRITEISAYAPTDWRDGDAFFPGLSFLRLLFQSHSLDELRQAHTDCLASPYGRALLNALFPRSPSAVWKIS